MELSFCLPYFKGLNKSFNSNTAAGLTSLLVLFNILHVLADRKAPISRM